MNYERDRWQRLRGLILTNCSSRSSTWSQFPQWTQDQCLSLTLPSTCPRGTSSRPLLNFQDFAALRWCWSPPGCHQGGARCRPAKGQHYIMHWLQGNLLKKISYYWPKCWYMLIWFERNLFKKLAGVKAMVTRPTNKRTICCLTNPIIRETGVTLVLDVVSLETCKNLSILLKAKT